MNRLVVFAAIALASCAAHFRPASPAPWRSTAAFDRGMAMYYGFDYRAAIHWFEQAAKEDPRSPLPQWGIALALGPNINDRAMEKRMAKASAALARARDLAANATGRERHLIDALGARYTTESTFEVNVLNQAYAGAMKSLAAQYPDDDDIAVLYAESLVLAEAPAAVHSHAHLNTAAVEAVEGVLTRNASHLGANHYHIHLLESSDPVRALPSAQRLDRLRPEAGHLLHMPSHIYLRLGDHHAAVESNRRAFAADLAVRKATGRLPDMGYHTREFLAAAAGFTGQSRVAREADDSIFVQLRFNRWNDVLQRKRPDGDVSLLEWHAARVLALIGLGRLEEAEAARTEYDAFEQKLPSDTQWWGDPIAKLLPLLRHEMAARMLWARRRHDESIAQWRHATAAQDELTRIEALMSWFHPARESLGAALMLDGRPQEAEQIFRDELKLNPGSARALFGLWKALAAQKRTSEAQAVETQFKDAWKSADVALSLDSL